MRRAGARFAAVALRVVALSVVAGGLLGCARKKAEQCTALVGVVNAGLRAQERAAAANTPSGQADLGAMAGAMEELAAKTAALPLSLPELRHVAADYQKMVKDIARAERELLGAAASKEREGSRRAAAELSLEAALKQEDAIVDALNRFCQGSP